MLLLCSFLFRKYFFPHRLQPLGFPGIWAFVTVFKSKVTLFKIIFWYPIVLIPGAATPQPSMAATQKNTLVLGSDIEPHISKLDYLFPLGLRSVIPNNLKKSVGQLIWPSSKLWGCLSDFGFIYLNKIHSNTVLNLYSLKPVDWC